MIDEIISFNSKYVAIAFDHMACDFTEVLCPAEGVFVCPKVPFNIDHRWQEWIGTLKTNEVTKANLVLISTLRSSSPTVMDAETLRLEATVLKLWYSILLLGVPAYSSANVISGGRLDSEVQIRQFSRLPTFYRGPQSPLFRLKSDLFPKAGRFFEVINKIYANPNKFTQLRRGLKAFQKALAESADYDRLHGFVRSLDAIVMTDKSRGRKSFIQRCRLFLHLKPMSDVTLGLMYDLRSRVEHQSDWYDLFSGAIDSERSVQASLITKQAEMLARAAYQVVLMDEDLLSLFENTDVIKTIWTSGDLDRFHVDEELKVDLSSGLTLLE